MATNDNPENKRQFARVPVALEVSMKFDNIDSFVSEISSDLSVGGIFIKTHRPRPLGTEVNLSIKLEDGKKLVEAAGKVVRIVHPGDVYSGAAPGMAIQFTRLHPQSKAIIEHCIEQKQCGDDRD